MNQKKQRRVQRASKIEFDGFCCPRFIPLPRVLLSIGLTYAIMITGFYLVISKSPWYYIPFLPVLVACQMYLTILAHDGIHGTFHKNSFINNLLNALVAYPVGQLALAGRRPHIIHHGSVGQEKDPYIHFYNDHHKDTQFNFILYFIKQFSGWRLIEGLIKGLLYSEKKNEMSVSKESLIDIVWLLIFQGLIFGIFIIMGHPLTYLGHLIPIITLVPGFNMMRNFVEHAQMPNAFHEESLGKNQGQREKIQYLYHVRSHWLERIFFSPCNFNYHAAHHFAPSVPYLYLPKLQQMILQNPTKYPFTERKGYVHFIKEYYSGLKNESRSGRARTKYTTHTFSGHQQ